MSLFWLLPLPLAYEPVLGNCQRCSSTVDRLEAVNVPAQDWRPVQASLGRAMGPARALGGPTGLE